MVSGGLKLVRLLVVLTFLVGMPILALPQSINWVEANLYPAPVAKQRPIAPVAAVVETVAHEEPLPSGTATSLESLGFAHPFENTAIASPSPLNPPPPTLTPERRRERMAECEQELQQLGATFYRLEALEQPAAAYRFVAQFEERGGLPARYELETTHDDPLVAMQEMIALVRSRISVARP